MNKKILGKFNWVDVIIAVAVIAAIVIVGIKFFNPSANPTVNNSEKIELSFFVEETPDYVANIVSVGDRIYDESKNCVLGNVKSVVVEESVCYAITSDGRVVVTSKPGYKSVKITSEVDAQLYENGVSVGVTKYGVGHTFTFYAGKAKLYGKLSGIGGAN